MDLNLTQTNHYKSEEYSTHAKHLPTIYDSYT
jgi:hypothetical protein